MNEDGCDLEILNHPGRHELHSSIPAAINNGPNVIDFYGQLPRFNTRPILNLLQPKEDPDVSGRYLRSTRRSSRRIPAARSSALTRRRRSTPITLP